jgi:hypothetical protein
VTITDAQVEAACEAAWPAAWGKEWPLDVAQDGRRRMRAALEAAEAAAWQPIATAPRDGTAILLWVEGMMHVAYWARAHGHGDWAWWTFADYVSHQELATRWRQLPAGPTP